MHAGLEALSDTRLDEVGFARRIGLMQPMAPSLTVKHARSQPSLSRQPGQSRNGATDSGIRHRVNIKEAKSEGHPESPALRDC